MATIKKNIAILGLNFQKELILFFFGILILAGAGVGLWILQGQIIFLLIPVLGSVVYGYVFFSRYGKKIKRLQREEEEEFVRLFTYFQVYLNDGYNIYNALSSIIPFATSSIGARLEKLISDIDNDKTIRPFVEFGNTFEDNQIRQVMLSIFQMVDQGNNKAYMDQFKHVFGRLSDQKHELHKKKRIERVQSMSVFPLIGSGVSMVILLAALVDIIGGVMNGF
ncbi:MAG: hypothetical protein II467_02260 [Bacilli bacterium]|nr:hypothetical protein [Bacilli bacterium]MBQ4255755.1 hypothetical protein [Bacilli bacterium]